MNSIRMGMITAAVASVLAASVSRADIVTYSATGLITQADSVASLPGANVGDSISFLFSVDTFTPGFDLGPGQSFYQSAIVSASAVVGQYTAPVQTFGNTVLIAADVPDGGNYGNSWLALSSPYIDSNFTGNSSGFQLLTAESGANPLNIFPDSSLSNAPLQSGDANFIDQLDLQFDSIVNGVVESSSNIVVGGDISIKQVTGTVSAPEIDSSSAAGALTLFAGIIAILRNRRTV
jgi:hypothetical protein